MSTLAATGDTPLWERQPNENTRSYSAFRIYRDMPPTKRDIAEVARQIKLSVRRTHEWAVEGEWRDRAAAWDDECHRAEDQERLELIRSMHSIHRRAGRAAIVKGLQALQILDPSDLTPPAVARLMELGARLERSTLIVSVEELQGVEVEEEETEDPWERIARELDPREPEHA